MASSIPPVTAQHEPNDNISYWVDSWAEICAIAQSKFFTFDYYNPHILLKDLIVELELSNRENQDNRDFFRNRLGSALRQDPAAGHYRVEIASIISSIVNKAPKDFLIHSCRSVLHTVFNNANYYRSLCKELKIAITSSHTGSKFETIYLLSRSLIVELWLHGYTFSKIREIPSQILDGCQNINGIIFHTSFPHGVSWKEYATLKESDHRSYYEAVKQKMSSVTLADRLDALISYVNTGERGARDILYIFPVKGVCQFDEVQIANVTFYSPVSKRFITEGYFGTQADDSELFGRKISEYDTNLNPLMNVAVAVETSDRGRQISTAIAAIQRAFDLMRLYEASPAKFSIDANWYCCATIDGKAAGSQSSGGQDFDDVIYAFNLDRFSDLKPKESLRLNKLIEGKLDNDLISRLALGLRWHRKAVDSNSDEDKVLYNWISIESLFASTQKEESPIRIILEKLPYIIMPDYLNSQCDDLKDQLLHDLQWRSIELPANSLEEYGISYNAENGTYSYQRSRFVEKMSELKIYVKSKRMLERLDSRHLFYSNNKAATEELNLFITNAEADILSVYRYRNRIVHNAQIDDDTLPLVANKAYHLARRVLEEALDYYLESEVIEMRSALTYIEIKVRIFLEKLKTNQVSSVLQYFDPVEQ